MKHIVINRSFKTRWEIQGQFKLLVFKGKTYYCPKPGPGFSMSYVVVFFCVCVCVFSEFRWEVIVHFVDFGGIVDHHCINFLFIQLVNVCRRDVIMASVWEETWGVQVSYPGNRQEGWGRNSVKHIERGCGSNGGKNQIIRFSRLMTSVA